MTQDELNVWLDLAIKVVIVVVPVAVPIIWGLIKAKLKLNEGKLSKITAITEQVVAEVYLEFVRKIKYGPNGGQNKKLSLKQIKEARNLAWAKAVALGKEKGLNYAKAVSKEYFPVLIDLAISVLSHGK